MPQGGQYTARSPTEARTFSFDFSRDLAPGDFLVSASTTLTAYEGVDPNASKLLIGEPTIQTGPAGAATVVAQRIGLNPTNLVGFAPSSIYAWAIQAVTQYGDTPYWVLYIPIGPV